MTILKAIPKMGGPKTSELDPFQINPKRRWDPKEDLVSTQGIVLSKEVSVAPLPGHCQVSSGKLCTLSFKNDVEFF